MSIYLSTDNIINTTDRALTTFSADAPAGTEQSYTRNVALPLVLVPGVYYLGAIADTGNRVGESRENNNAGIGNQIHVASDIDLVTTSVSGPSSGSPGQQISITIGIKNQGSVGAGESFITAYFSIDSIIITDDTELGSVYVNKLGALVQQTVTFNTTIPTSLNGSYYIGAIADGRSDVTESNENNNSLAGNQISVASPLPDLVPASISGPTSGNQGQQIQAIVVVENQGTVTSGGFSVGVYLSLDATITTTDIQVGLYNLSSLAAGGQQTVTINCTIPSKLTPVTYYLGAIADGGNSVSESNENNNSLAGNQISIASAFPDLILLSVSGPSSAGLGKSIPITVVVKNQGTASSGGFYVGVYLSTDPTMTTNDKKIGTIYLNGLAANAEQTVTINGKVPSKFSLGSYYVGAIADIEKRVAESNESNNAQVGNAISITRR
jgi:subtilase family serine protease